MKATNNHLVLCMIFVLIIYFKGLLFNYIELCCLISNAFCFSVTCRLPLVSKMTYTSFTVILSAGQIFLNFGNESHILSL